MQIFELIHAVFWSVPVELPPWFSSMSLVMHSDVDLVSMLFTQRIYIIIRQEYHPLVSGYLLDSSLFC